MKQKSGFTLVELMATIVVLAIIIAIAMPIYNKLSINIKEKNYTNKVKLIETAAAKYSEDTNYETMYVDDLIKDGYLDADDEDGNIYNDLTNERINCYVVKSKEEAGIYYAELLDESYQLEDNTCIANMPNTMNDKLKIIMRLENGNEFEYDKISKWWTKENIILEAQVIGEIKDIEWYQGYSQSPLDTNSKYFTDIQNNKDKRKIKVSTDSVLQQSYTVKVTLSDGKILNSTVRVYIDKIKPNFYDNNNIENTTWVTSLSYEIKAYDNESGLLGYKILDEDKECPTTREAYEKSTRKATFTENGKKTICIMDNVGNINKNELLLNSIDNTNVSCYFDVEGEKGNNVDGKQWYKSSVELSLHSLGKPGKSGIYLGISTINQPIYETDTEILVDENTNGVTYYGYIKTGAGKTNSCDYKTYIEKNIIAPEFKTYTSYYNMVNVDYNFVEPISGSARKYCEFYIDGSTVPKVVEADTNGNCVLNTYSVYGNYPNNTKTWEIKSCIESKAGNLACSELNTLKIPGLTNIGPPNNVVYAIVHDIYYANPAIYKDCKNAGYASYCRVFTSEAYNYNKNSTVTVVEYCPNPDRTGACLYDTQSSGCSVESFLRISKSNPVNALSPLDKPDLLPEWQTKYKRQDKDNSPLWSKNIDGTYHSNISCKNDDGTADGRYINVQPYQFCDDGCGNGHIKNFENSCNMANAHIYYNQWFYSMGNSFKYNYCIYSSRDDARYYQDEIGNIHDWYVSVDNRIPF